MLPEDLLASACWKIPCLLAPGTDRTALTQRLKATGVVVDWAYQPPLHLQPVFRALWSQSATSLPPEFVAFVNGLIAETPLAEPEDTVARFQADLAKIKTG